MATPVVTVAVCGIPVVDVTAGLSKDGPAGNRGRHPNMRGTPVIKVATFGIPVTYGA